MSLVRRLLAQVDMHHAGAGVKRRPRLARHFLRRYRDVMLFRIGQHAVQRAGNDSLVGHGYAFARIEGREPVRRIMRPAKSRFLRPRAIVRSTAWLRAPLPERGTVRNSGIAAVDREIPRAGEYGTRLQSIEPAERMAETGGVGVAYVLGQIDVFVDEMQQMPRALPGAERPERHAGLLLEQVQEPRRR